MHCTTSCSINSCSPSEMEWLRWYIFLRTDTTNNLLDVVDVSLPDNVTVHCTFLSGFTGSAHCTVQYGTDPTYMNLPYSAESTETGTAGDTVSVVLRERLNSSTVYYYTVSAVSGDVTVVVQGTFMTPLYSEFTYFKDWMVDLATVSSMSQSASHSLPHCKVNDSLILKPLHLIYFPKQPVGSHRIQMSQNV